MIGDSQLIGISGETLGKNAAMPKQLGIRVFRMANGDIRKKDRLFVARRRHGENGGNRPVNVLFADERKAIVANLAQRKAGHDARRFHHRPPALRRNRRQPLFLRPLLYGALQHDDIAHFFIGNARGFKAFAHFGAFAENRFAVFFSVFFQPRAQIGHGHRQNLDAEFLQKLHFIAFYGGERRGARADLPNAQIAKRLDDADHRQKALKAFGERRIVHGTVLDIGKRHAVHAQYL